MHLCLCDDGARPLNDAHPEVARMFFKYRLRDRLLQEG
jgi:hypothetical protein